MDQLNATENKKCSPGKVFGINYPQTLNWPKNEIMSFFKFLQKEISRLDKKIPKQNQCTEPNLKLGLNSKFTS